MLDRRCAITCTVFGTLSAVVYLMFSSLAVFAQVNRSERPQAGNPTDLEWSQRVVDSTLTRWPDAHEFGSWSYPRGLYLFGQYLVYKRTGDKHYLQYIRDWVDAHIDAEGHLDREVHALDDVLAANLLVVLYHETREPRYKLAAQIFRARFDSYPRTSDGGLWHATVPSRQWQLWLDGTYMAVPFLLRYGQEFDDAKYSQQEAVRQLIVFHKHLQDAHRGLLYHAYDESGKAPWANPVTHHSALFWCRAMGWYGMTLVDTLDALPKNDRGQRSLIRILRKLVEDLARDQDSKTGLWYQIVDKTTVTGNWTETSSSAMFTYIIDIAVKRKYISAKYLEVAAKGYRGVLSRISLGNDGLTNLEGICEGTNVGDLQYYFNRKRNTNDLHGLGAFLLMNEEWNTSVSSFRETASSSR